MTACGFHLFVFVLLSLLNLSEEGCLDYFAVKDRGQYANHNVSMINTTAPEDTLECTVERECLKAMNECETLVRKKCANSVERNCSESGMRNCTHNIPYCNWLVHCYKRTENATEKCEGNVSRKLNGYHLVCLTAKQLGLFAEGCDYDTVYELYEKIQPFVSDETSPTTTTTTTTTTKTTLPETTTTTAAPTTTLPDTTRATTTTATLPDTTRATTTTATLPDTTRATTTTATLPDTTRATTTATTTTTTTTALSPTVTQSAVSGNNADPSKSLHKADNNATNTDTFQVLFAISAIVNVIAALGIWYMRRRWTQDRRQRVDILVLETNGHLPEAQVMTELRSDTPPPPSANREEESTHLMTECQSIVTHSADTDRHCCAAGEDTPL